MIEFSAERRALALHVGRMGAAMLLLGGLVPYASGKSGTPARVPLKVKASRAAALVQTRS